MLLGWTLIANDAGAQTRQVGEEVQRQPVYLFHLAWAQQLLGKQALKEASLDDARRAGMNADQIHPLEMPKYRELYGAGAK